MQSSSERGGFRVLRMKTLATSQETNGSFELIEDMRNEGEGPAPHIHRHSDEAFYVLSGRFKFFRDAAELDASPGDLVFIPRGSRHFYQAIASDSRVLILYIPAGRFDEFLRQLDSLLVAGMTSGEAMATLRGKYDSDPA